jgi:hypothetical protein
LLRDERRTAAQAAADLERAQTKHCKDLADVQDGTMKIIQIANQETESAQRKTEAAQQQATLNTATDLGRIQALTDEKESTLALLQEMTKSATNAQQHAQLAKEEATAARKRESETFKKASRDAAIRIMKNKGIAAPIASPWYSLRSPDPSSYLPSWETLQTNTRWTQYYKDPTSFITYVRDLDTPGRALPPVLPLSQNYPNPIVIAIGDVNGDIEALLFTLWYANVIDYTGAWIAVNTIVIQTGNQIYRKGPFNDVNESNRFPEFEVLQYTEFLTQEARDKHNGSKFISLLGIDEIFACIDDQADRQENVSTSDQRAYTTPLTRTTFFQNHLQKFLCKRRFVVQIGNCIFSNMDLGSHVGFRKDLDTQLTLFNNTVFSILTIHQDDLPVKTKDFFTLHFLDVLNPRPAICSGSEKADRELPYENLSKYFISGNSINDRIRGRKNPGDNTTAEGRFWCITTGMSRAFNDANDTTLRYSKAASLEITNVTTENPTFKVLTPLD